MTLYYEGSDGTIIDFMSGGIYAQNPETLADSEWKYGTISGVNGLGRVKNFYKDTQEASLKLAVMADTAEEFNTIMYNLHRTFERDIRRMKPGKLWWNGFSKEVFAVENGYDDFEELFEAVEKDVTFISVYPYWTKETTYSYPVDMTTVTGSLDFDYDFDIDFDAEELTEVIENDCIDAANFAIKFYGPCTNPYIIIGGHTYRVLVTVPDGSYVSVNSLTKKILLVDEYSETENVFYLRDRDSYIFQQIPEGRCVVTRNRETAVDVTIFDERGEPEWI